MPKRRFRHKKTCDEKWKSKLVFQRRGRGGYFVTQAKKKELQEKEKLREDLKRKGEFFVEIRSIQQMIFY